MKKIQMYIACIMGCMYATSDNQQDLSEIDSPIDLYQIQCLGSKQNIDAYIARLIEIYGQFVSEQQIRNFLIYTVGGFEYVKETAPNLIMLIDSPDISDVQINIDGVKCDEPSLFQHLKTYQVAPGQILNICKVSQATDALQRKLHSVLDGRSVRVEHQIYENVVIFNCKTYDVSQIRKIFFTGLSEINPRTLEAALPCYRSVKFQLSCVNITPSKHAIKHAITKAANALGFLDFKVLTVEHIYVRKLPSLIIEVYEGPQYSIGAIDCPINYSKYLLLQTGDFFTQKSLERSMCQIQKNLPPDRQIKPVITYDRHSKTVNIRFIEQYISIPRLRAIYIHGNVHNSSEVILGALHKLIPGQVLYPSYIQQTEAQLMSLGLFEKVHIKQKVVKPGLVDLEIIVRELPGAVLPYLYNHFSIRQYGHRLELIWASDIKSIYGTGIKYDWHVGLIIPSLELQLFLRQQKKQFSDTHVTTTATAIAIDNGHLSTNNPFHAYYCGLIPFEISTPATLYASLKNVADAPLDIHALYGAYIANSIVLKKTVYSLERIKSVDSLDHTISYSYGPRIQYEICANDISNHNNALVQLAADDKNLSAQLCSMLGGATADSQAGLAWLRSKNNGMWDEHLPTSRLLLSYPMIRIYRSQYSTSIYDLYSQTTIAATPQISYGSNEYKTNCNMFVTGQVRKDWQYIWADTTNELILTLQYASLLGRSSWWIDNIRFDNYTNMMMPIQVGGPIDYTTCGYLGGTHMLLSSVEYKYRISPVNNLYVFINNHIGSVWGQPEWDTGPLINQTNFGDNILSSCGLGFIFTANNVQVKCGINIPISGTHDSYIKSGLGVIFPFILEFHTVQ